MQRTTKVLGRFASFCVWCVWLLASGGSLAASSGSIQQVQSMYVAYYGRPADPGGLEWWANELDSNNGNLSAIINAFGNSEEYNKRFGSMTTTELLNNLYQQMFGRDAETEGLAWWREQIESGKETLATAAVAIADGAVDGVAMDQTTFNKRVQVAQSFTDQISSQSKAYTEGNINEARDLILQVNSDTDVSAFTSQTAFTNAIATLPAGGENGIKVARANVTTSNSDDLGVAAARGIKKSIANQQTQSRTSGLVGGLGNVASGVVLEGVCDSGTLDYGVSGEWFVMTYDQCAIGQDIFNGGLNFQTDVTGLATTMVYSDLSIYSGSESYTMWMDGTMEFEMSSDLTTSTTIFRNFSYEDSWGDSYYWELAVITCTNLASGGEGTCDFDEAQFVDAWTGETYYIEGEQVSVTSDGGYQVSTRVYDTEYGYVDVTTTSELKLDASCTTGMFSSGSVLIEGSDGSSAEIEFLDCNTFSVTVDGVTQTYNWEQFKKVGD